MGGIPLVPAWEFDVYCLLLYLTLVSGFEHRTMDQSAKSSFRGEKLENVPELVRELGT